MQRLITSADFAVLYTIYMDEENNPFLSYEPMSVDAFKPLFEELLEAANVYVYEVDGAIIATYAIQRKKHRTAHIAYIGSLAMHPAHRAKGLGTIIIGELVQQLKAEGFVRIELYVDADNPRGIYFYQKLGFTAEAILKKAFKRANQDFYVDEIVMSIVL